MSRDTASQRMMYGAWQLANEGPIGVNSKGLPVPFQGSHQGCLLNNQLNHYDGSHGHAHGPLLFANNNCHLHQSNPPIPIRSSHPSPMRPSVVSKLSPPLPIPAAVVVSTPQSSPLLLHSCTTAAVPTRKGQPSCSTSKSIHGLNTSRGSPLVNAP